MNRFSATCAFLLCTLFVFQQAGSADDSSAIDFNRDVRSILSDYCVQCHGPDEESREADLRLDTSTGATADRGGYAALIPGDPDASELIRRIESLDDPMPPVDSKRKLTAKQKQTLRAWVEAGGQFDQHWSFVPPRLPAVPLIDDETKNPIDAFIGRRLKAEGLSFSQEASPETLIRRVTLDLTGVPPTLEEVDAFVAAYAVNPEPTWSLLIDRLISSPRYGETMALPWLDAARFADTDGYQYDGPRYQWRYRDWVIDAYNANMPFDQFTIEQLAGDLLPDASNAQRVATAFNRNHRYNSEAGLVVEEFLLENAVDRVDTTATLWMGLAVGCARCHDHKFDPISTKEYYQLIGFFNSIPEAGRAIKNGNSEPLVISPDDAQARQLAEWKQAVERQRAALRPGDVAQNGGPLIDRKLVHQFALKSPPASGFKAVGAPRFEDQVMYLDGQSAASIGGIDKSVTFRADATFSISFWVSPAAIQEGVILSRQNPGSTRPGIEIAMLQDGRVQFDLISRWMAGVGRAVSETSLPEGEWTHVTLVNDGSQSANGQWIYFNGQRVPTDVQHNTNSNVGGVKQNQPLLLGKGIRPDASMFKGALRDVRLYAADLFDEEIEILAAPYGGEKRKRFSRIKMTPAYGEYVVVRDRLRNYMRSLPTVMVMEETPVAKPTFVRVRGVYNSYGDQVERDVPASLPSFPDSYPRNRLGLAKWLVDPEHPLTARVAVNRYWQKYFGTGLVKTPEDFGTQGDLPSHPELLDWLAVTFTQSGWDVASMQKRILTSRTYRQSSRVTPELLEADPDNRMLARGARLRLSGHTIRDQALFVSGLLDHRIGGPSVSPYQPAGLWREMSMGMTYKPSTGADLFRRSLYTIWKRTVAPPTLAVFDAADRESCRVGREQTNTPLQALTLLNETGFVENARYLAVRMLHQKDPLSYGFRLLTSKTPTPTQLQILTAAQEEYQVHFETNPADAKALAKIDQIDGAGDFTEVQIASMTAVANVLLNLDEAITRE
ncbi:Planctomycete cytochrome C [Roseimaritima multifibrata]|uniref:Planctomycete cytochrome C n=1 Tax=Roseimaritima multifibrata TaxID=1930274 RepID=A0A517MG06_9BACT|nr:DUF1553 domain-containing protein [Roseimaritima multifibrata]QDS93697.1 Planctomycete cytochrome C [Roseimaritima multifibrata]